MKVNVELAKAVKQLRLALGISSQEKLALMGAEHGLERLDVRAVEDDEKANSYKVRRGLAGAFGMSMDDFDAYVEERIPLSKAVVLASDAVRTFEQSAIKQVKGVRAPLAGSKKRASK